MRVGIVIRAGAGEGAALTHADDRQNGATIAPHAAAVWGDTGLVRKFKAPVPQEIRMVRPDTMPFAYQQPAADRVLNGALLASGGTSTLLQP